MWTRLSSVPIFDDYIRAQHREKHRILTITKTGLNAAVLTLITNGANYLMPIPVRPRYATIYYLPFSQPRDGFLKIIASDAVIEQNR